MAQLRTFQGGADRETLFTVKPTKLERFTSVGVAI